MGDPVSRREQQTKNRNKKQKEKWCSKQEQSRRTKHKNIVISENTLFKDFQNSKAGDFTVFAIFQHVLEMIQPHKLGLCEINVLMSNDSNFVSWI